MADLSPELTARIQALEGSYADNPGRYFVALAGAWREAGEPGRAEEILRENLKYYPGLSAHVLLGRCLADRGAFPEAANEFHYVLSIDAQNLIALRTLAEMAAASGRRGEAERWYNELLSVDPMNAEARAALQELARGGADASVADQPMQVGSGWGGAAEPLPVAGGADAGDADEFGMIDLSTPDTSAADASGVASDDGAGEWGDLPLDLAAASASAPTSASDDFDAFGFGSVDLDASPAAPTAYPAAADQTGAVDAWLDADARQDLGESAAEDRGALAPLGDDDALLHAPLAGADLPFLDTDDTGPADDLPLLDTDHTVPAGLPLLDAEPAGFPAFDASSRDDRAAFGAGALPAFDADEDDADHADHPVDAEVVTETMAELYAAQGLLQQSADTYRELIRRRGDEPGLVRRLAEIEARLHSAAVASAQEEAPDWLASVDAFALGGAAAGLAAVHMSAEPEPTPEPEPEPVAAQMDDAVEEPGYATAAVVADYAQTEAAAPADDFAAPEPAFAQAPPVAGFVPPPPPMGAGASSDPFADSFEGGFDGVEAPAPAFAAAPVEVAGGDREPWEAPSVHETEAVGFDLIVVEEDGDVVAAPPEVVADVSADWAIAAAPLGDDDDAEEALAATSPRAASMRDYFSSLLAWTPGQSAAPAAAPAASFDAAPEPAPAPSFDAAPFAEPAAADEPWTQAPAAGESPAVEEPWTESPVAEPPVDEEPWAEAPAPPAGAPAYEAPADTPAAQPAAAEADPWSASAPEAAPHAGAAGDIPLFDLDAEPWAEPPRAAEPPAIDAFELSDEIAGPGATGQEEALPWELPAQPGATPAEAAAEVDPFSFEDFFSGGGAPAAEETRPAAAPAPRTEPEPELPPSFVPSLAFEPVEPQAAAPAAPAASSPAGGQDEDDEDLESFQAWLQSLKR